MSQTELGPTEGSNGNKGSQSDENDRHTTETVRIRIASAEFRSTSREKSSRVPSPVTETT